MVTYSHSGQGQPLDDCHKEEKCTSLPILKQARPEYSGITHPARASNVGGHDYATVVHTGLDDYGIVFFLVNILACLNGRQRLGVCLSLLTPAQPGNLKSCNYFKTISKFYSHGGLHSINCFGNHHDHSASCGFAYFICVAKRSIIAWGSQFSQGNSNMLLGHYWLSHLAVLLLKGQGTCLTLLQECGFSHVRVLGPLLVMSCFHHNVVPPLSPCGPGTEAIDSVGDRLL